MTITEIKTLRVNLNFSSIFCPYCDTVMKERNLEVFQAITLFLADIWLGFWCLTQLSTYYANNK
jgi:hypothetical protein